MSKYYPAKSAVQSSKALVDAMIDCLYRRKVTLQMSEEEKTKLKAECRDIVNASVEMCKVPQHLIGYHGDERNEVADVIFRRNFVNAHLSGGASNDVGFRRLDDGNFESIVSQYDSGRWWNAASQRYWQAAQASEAVDSAWLNGAIEVETVDQDDVIKIHCVMPN
ncbi:MAG: hypothetical protein WCV82_04105 [Candidatus Paceibacterota bacterium]